MNENEIYLRLQKPILALANSNIGRYYLGIPKNEKKIIQLNGWGYQTHLGGNHYKARFAAYPHFNVKLKYLLRLGLLPSLFVLPKLALPLVMLDTFAVNNPGGGDVTESTTGTTWGTSRAVSAGDTVQGISDALDRLHANNASGNFVLGRVSLVSDSSELPDGAGISRGSWTVVSSAQTITDTYDIALVGNTQASNIELVVGDIDQLQGSDINTPIEFATRQTVSGASQTFTFTFNANGIAQISKTSSTKMALRSGAMDIDNSGPTGTNVIRITWGIASTYLTVEYTGDLDTTSKYW